MRWVPGIKGGPQDPPTDRPPEEGHFEIREDSLPSRTPEGDYSCTVPLLAKYMAFASQEHPDDQVVDDLYQTASDVFHGISGPYTDWIPENIADAFIKADVGCNKAEQQELMSQGKSVLGVCSAVGPRERRLNKIVAVETLVHARHEKGLLIEWACRDMDETRPGEYPAHIECQRSLTQMVLDSLAEG